MQNNHTKPPNCCVIIEMEQGARLGYRRAVLLNEINALGSLTKAAKTSYVSLPHAHDLIKRMNREFSKPLIAFNGPNNDEVQLTAHGEAIKQKYWLRFEPIWLDILQERSRHY